ncbi:helix-turn-helix domain-containing protein [Carboxylicivirga caseinilyticus]|uniref:helix-turn-helix domain-containing protein n=1 Tax=Carboxylicivirga caseinilyticus TaxID=3417572 RepID=UPI003D33EF7A|nr:helix-turn-helix domain-containing protein [Marinilabiliaceae bacterium A049]
MKQENLLTVAEVADIFRVTDRTIYNWITLKKIKALHFGRKYLIQQSEVNRILTMS